MTSKTLHYSLFGEPWWLDIVAGPGRWDEVRIESGGRVDARFPYVINRGRHGVTLGMPPFTKMLGPWFAHDESRRYSTILARQKDLTEEIVSRLPRHDVFRQGFHHEIDNWLPWYWHGFVQKTHYTYSIDSLTDTEALWNKLQSNIRGDIRKASGRFGLVVRDDMSAEILADLCVKTSERQSRRPPDRKRLIELVEAVTARGQGRVAIAVDKRGRACSGVFTVWDERRAYYLIGGSDPELKNSGAQSFVLWDAITHASRVSRSFDFEGSMVESIERYFRAFGARQRPFFRIERVNGRWRRALFHLGTAISEIAGRAR